MEKLTLKEIAGYLPYELECFLIDDKMKGVLIGLGEDQGIFDNDMYWFNQFKPLLYPLEMLTKQIVYNGVEIIPIDHIDDHHNFSLLRKEYLLSDPKRYPYSVVEWLFEMHFDIHGLIPRGLAIDKSKLKP